MRNIARAIEFEASRQVDIIEQGGVIDQETRLFDALIGETKTMRSQLNKRETSIKCVFEYISCLQKKCIAGVSTRLLISYLRLDPNKKGTLAKNF